MQALDTPTPGAARETAPAVLHIMAIAMGAGIMAIITRMAVSLAAMIAAGSRKYGDIAPLR